jgi:inosose dehydratase
MALVRVSVGAAPITWGVCELPDWGEVPPYPRVLDEIGALGFRGTELGPAGYLPGDLARLRRELQERGLALVGAFCPLSLHDPALAPSSLRAAEELANFLAEVGCPTLIAADAGDEGRRAIAGRVAETDALPPDAWRRMGEGLASLAEACARQGVRVVFHPHAGTYVETEGELEALMGASPPESVGLCLDTGHVAYGGADPVAVCRRHAARVWHVHAKDVRPEILDRVRREGTDYATAVGQGVFAPLGDGCVDFPALVAVLREADYGGWVVLEQDVRVGAPWPAQDARTNARRSLAYLRAIVPEVK